VVEEHPARRLRVDEPQPVLGPVGNRLVRVAQQLPEEADEPLVSRLRQLADQKRPYPLVALLVDGLRELVENQPCVLAHVEQDRVEVRALGAAQLQQPNALRHPGKARILPPVPLVLRVDRSDESTPPRRRHRGRGGRVSPAVGSLAMAEIANIVKVTAAEGKRDEALAVLSRLVEATESEPGTLQYALYADTTDDVTIWFTELYTDEDAMKQHMASPAMAEIGGALGGLFDGPADIRRVELVRSKGGKGG
jgi:quinol monooxygenase YgiN